MTKSLPMPCRRAGGVPLEMRGEMPAGMPVSNCVAKEVGSIGVRSGLAVGSEAGGGHGTATGRPSADHEEGVRIVVDILGVDVRQGHGVAVAQIDDRMTADIDHPGRHVGSAVD